MAKVTGPLFSFSASGNIKKTLVYTSSKGVAIVKKLTPATDFRTSEQADRRNLYQLLVGVWNGLTQGQKTTWNDQAVGHPLTGFNIFMSYYLDLYKNYFKFMKIGSGKIGVNVIGIALP